jgi:hypothetical protein
VRIMFCSYEFIIASHLSCLIWVATSDHQCFGHEYGQRVVGDISPAVQSEQTLILSALRRLSAALLEMLICAVLAVDVNVGAGVVRSEDLYRLGVHPAAVPSIAPNPIRSSATPGSALSR